MRQAFNDLRKRIAPQAEENVVLVYYTGHADQQALMMGDDQFPLAEFKKNMDDLPARIRISLLDACQSGSMTRIKGGTLAEPFLFKEDSRIKGDVVLYSSSASENAQESDLYKNSIFTFHFINALRGCGDVTNDRKITLNEAYNYSYAHTVASTAQTSGGVQHPGYQFKIKGEGDIVIADLTLRTQGVILDADVSGGVTILDENGALTADFTKDAASQLFVALSPGKYQIINRFQTVKKQAHIVIDSSGTNKITTKDLLIASQGTKGRSKGDAVPPRKGLSFGVSLSGELDYTDYTVLTQALRNEFSGYSLFGISPDFKLGHFNFLRIISFEVEYPQSLILGIAYGEYQLSTSASYAGTTANPIDNSSFRVQLSTKTTLKDRHFQLAAGYRMPYGKFQNASLQAGLLIHHTQVSVTSSFNDELMNTSAQSKAIYQGSIVTPYLELGYLYPIYSHLEIAGYLRYKYQDKNAKVSNDQATIYSELPVRMDGPSIGLSIIGRFGRTHKGVF